MPLLDMSSRSHSRFQLLMRCLAKHSTMQTPCTIVVGIVASIILFGCSDRSKPTVSNNPKVKAVQTAVLAFDRSITVGNAFAQYQYIRNVQWTEGEPVQGRTFVDVTGDVDADRLFTNLLKPGFSPEVIEFGKTHDLRQIEREWKPKLSHMKMSCRFRLNADGSVEATRADFEEHGHGPWYLWADSDVNAVVRMVYYGSMPLFVLEGFVHPDGRP